jgi:hypothetical protein
MKRRKQEQAVDLSVCCRPRCRQPAEIGYHGQPLCWGHWQKLCDQQELKWGEQRAHEDNKPC